MIFRKAIKFFNAKFSHDAIHLSVLLGHTDINTVKQYLLLQRKESSVMIQEVSKELLRQIVNSKRSPFIAQLVLILLPITV